MTLELSEALGRLALQRELLAGAFDLVGPARDAAVAAGVADPVVVLLDRDDYLGERAARGLRLDPLADPARTLPGRDPIGGRSRRDRWPDMAVLVAALPRRHVGMALARISPDLADGLANQGVWGDPVVTVAHGFAILHILPAGATPGGAPA